MGGGCPCSFFSSWVESFRNGGGVGPAIRQGVPFRMSRQDDEGLNDMI